MNSECRCKNVFFLIKNISKYDPDPDFDPVGSAVFLGHPDPDPDNSRPNPVKMGPDDNTS